MTTNPNIWRGTYWDDLSQSHHFVVRFEAGMCWPAEV